MYIYVYVYIYINIYINIYTYCIYRLLFHTTANPNAVHKSNLEGQEQSSIATTDLGEPFGLDLDFLNKRLFWANNSKFLFEDPLRRFTQYNYSFKESWDHIN